MSSSLEQEFGSIRSCFWPIHWHERRKLVPMLIMICLIVFSYDLLRNMKDAVAITASGAEVIPFIKVWVLLPCAVLLTYAFTKLSNMYSQERVFYIIITGFLAFFALFAFVLYPLRHTLHADTLANFMQGYFPVGLKGMVAMIRHWSFTLFYVMAELWGSIVMTVLFWGFANQVTRISEARRFFGVFCFGANCCAILAGQVSKLLPHENVDPSIVREDWTLPLMILVVIVIACGGLVMGIFRWMNKNVLNDPSFEEFHSTKKTLKAKGKLSIRESFSYLTNSKYLLCIATIVLSYNLVINLVEVVWKDQLRRLYPSPADYFDFMGGLTSMIGVFSAMTSLMMARIIGRLGWTGTALITPMMMLVTCAGFFGFLFYQNYIGDAAFFLGTSPLAIAVMFGAAQNCLSKAMKYSVFDATKEMAFVPLSQESKLKGKAAIDGVGSRLGKSGGSLIHTCLLMLCGSLTASAPFVAVILMAVIGFWIYSTKSLGMKFNELVSEEEPVKEKAKPEATASADPVGVVAAPTT